MRFLLGLHLFFALWSSLFACGVSTRSLRFFSVTLSFVSLPVLYGLHPSFSASYTSGKSSLLTLRLFSSVLQVLLGHPSVVRVLLPCRFSFVSLSQPASGSSLSLGLPFPPSWLFLLVLVVVFFTPVLVLSPPGPPCSVAVAFGCLFSDSFESLVPVATWSPFGTSRHSFGFCFLDSSCLSSLVAFSVLSPLRSSALFASSMLFVSCSPDGFSFFFSWCSVSFGVGSFLGPFFFFTLSSSVSGFLRVGASR